MGILRNSISPVNSEEFVPPRVNVPPGTSSTCKFCDRASQNAISGDESWLLVANASQKGVARVLAKVANAKPIRPDAPNGSLDNMMPDMVSTVTTVRKYSD